MDNKDSTFEDQLKECFKDFQFDDIIKKPKRLTKNPSKKRQRKTKEQMKLLEQYLEKYDDWSNELVEEISQETGLKSKQVSKWFWDQKTKGRTPSSRKSCQTKTHKRVKTAENETFEDFSEAATNSLMPAKEPEKIYGEK